jgi:endonuclease YncB( thermonuclease family)
MKRPGRCGRPSVEVFLRRRRRAPLLAALAGLLLLAAAAWADRRGLLLYTGDDVARYDGGSFMVARVVDGDTLDLAVPDGAWRTTRVRLWGVDTPELARPEEGRPAEPRADEARRRSAELAEGERVRLELEPSRVRDRYGRLLAFVHLPDGTLLNEHLLSEGLAEADDRWPHRRVERFDLLEDGARRKRAGVWAEPRER